MADILALVVDDSRMARYVLSKMLQEQGINVDSVESAEEALGYLCNNLPDMIFMDHTMPGMDGFQAIRAIKNDPQTASVPIMMYTSKEGDEYISQARAIGAVDVLPKQLKAAQLVKILERQQLLPRQINNKAQFTTPSDNSPAKPAEAKSSAPVVTARDIGQDLEQVAKDAERSIEHKSFTNEVKQLLDDHREELSEQSSAHSQALLETLDHKIDSVSSSLSEFILETRENSGLFHKQSDGTKIFLICINILILVILGFYTVQQSTEIKQLHTEKQILLDTASVNAARNRAKMTLETPAPESEPNINTGPTLLHTAQWTTSLQWALNRKNQFPWNKKPFDINLAKLLESTADKLHEAGFKGSINVISHLGQFCLIANDAGDPELPSDEQTLSECTINNANEQQAELLGLEKTPQFERHMTETEQLYGEDLLISFTSTGLSTPAIEYPEKSPELSAAKWNDIARQNHRITIELSPQQ